MGAPISSPSFSEIHLQYLENTEIFDILVKHHIIGYCGFVDDILLVYQNSATNINEVLNTSNKLHLHCISLWKKKFIIVLLF
jgi:heat shock protein HspQ